jgi:hypothetical protein
MALLPSLQICRHVAHYPITQGGIGIRALLNPAMKRVLEALWNSPQNWQNHSSFCNAGIRISGANLAATVANTGGGDRTFYDPIYSPHTWIWLTQET